MHTHNNPNSDSLHHQTAYSDSAQEHPSYWPTITELINPEIFSNIYRSGWVIYMQTQQLSEALLILLNDPAEIGVSDDLADQLLEVPFGIEIDYEREWKDKGIPLQPYYITLACSVCQWNSTGSTVYLNMGEFEGLSHNKELMESLDSCTEEVKCCFDSHWPPQEDPSTVKEEWKHLFKVLLPYDLQQANKCRTLLNDNY